jgi:serine/threonine-protein kinase
VRALDLGQLADGRVYLLMEHATGNELGAWLDAYGAMPFERCLAVLRQVASAVDYLHLKGIVHGDIKPANILIDPAANDFVKLVDFGIAAASSREERQGVLGTPAYMAPEQARGEAWGPHSDVYAVAALAMQMLTGHPPHDYGTAQDVLTAVLTEPAATPSAFGVTVPGLDAVFEKGLQRDPTQRFGRASAFVKELSDVLSAAPLTAAGVGVTSQVRAVAVPPRASADMGRSSGFAALSCFSQSWGRVRNERAWRKLAACVVAAVFAFSVYG